MALYERTIERLEEMRSRFDSGFSPSDRTYLEALNFRLFNKPITLTGCSNCYRDAYVLIFNKLKRDKKMPTEVNYILKNGALLHEFGTSEYYSHRVSDEVAEHFLKKDPESIRLFHKFPSDWKERINKSKTEKAVKAEVETEKKEVESTPTNEAKQSTLFEEEAEKPIVRKRQSRKNS